MWGHTLVPWTVAWTVEQSRIWVGRCPHVQKIAICQLEAPGHGRPMFGTPHHQRQRRAIQMGWCDLCGRSLRNSTKVSLSKARPRGNAAEGWAVLQVEPMLHRGCAALSTEWCPSLKRDVRSGEVEIRRVTQWRAQLAVLRPDKVPLYVPGYVVQPGQQIVGAAKVELQKWTRETLGWLVR